MNGAPRCLRLEGHQKLLLQSLVESFAGLFSDLKLKYELINYEKLLKIHIIIVFSPKMLLALAIL